MSNDPRAWFEECRQALGVTQAELGRLLGVSRRTAQRWSSDGIPSYAAINLARVVHARDPALAGEIVATLGTTLEAAGIVLPAQPQAPALPPDGLVDAVVCAVTEAMEIMPKQVRPGLLAAFARAKELGLTVDMMERALRSSLRPAPAPPEPPDARAPKSKRPRG